MDVNANLVLRAGCYIVARIERVASLPAWSSPDEGRLIYAEDTREFYKGDNAAWEAMGTTVVAGDASILVVNGNEVSVIADTTTMKTDSSGFGVKDLGIASAQLAASSVTNAKIDGGAVTSDKIAALGVVASHISTSATQAVLEGRNRPVRDQVNAVSTGATSQSTDVDTETTSTASNDTPQTTLTGSKGVFVGIDSINTAHRVPIRNNASGDPVVDGDENDVYGILTSLHYSSGLSSVTGVTIPFTSHQAVNGATLSFTFSSTELTWNAGTAVDVSTDGYYKLVGPAITDFIVVKVVNASLPGSDQSDILTLTDQGYRLGYFSDYLGVAETPYEFVSDTSIDFRFVEIFDRWDVPTASLLTNTGFVDVTSVGAHNHDGVYSSISHNHDGTYAQSYAETFTSSTSWVVTHNLGTEDVIVACYDSTTPRLQAIPEEVELTDTNTVTITWATALAGRVVVMGV